MKIHGVERLTAEQLDLELQRGARFVFFQYCVSILVMTFKRSSGIYFVRHGESVVTRGLPWTLVSLLLGWWGIPWGPIWTVSTVYRNLSGGRDVTSEVVASLNASVPAVRMRRAASI